MSRKMIEKMVAAVAVAGLAGSAWAATGPSSSQSPYVVSTNPLVTNITSITTVGDNVPKTGGGTYRMVGIPDGLGAYDNNDGTFTILMNHELGPTQGIARAHGSTGAFVSQWIIRKSDLAVVSANDLVTGVHTWNSGTSSYNALGTTQFNRLCSADLPAISAFFNSASGLGTTNRIFMNGEEAGAEGRAFAHVVTGTDAGKSWELPRLGKFSWENSVASPFAQDKTIVVGLDDSTPGEVYVYIGQKTNTGLDIEKAGLTNGNLYGIQVNGLPGANSTETRANGLGAGPGVVKTSTFSLFNHGNVQNSTGAALDTASEANAVTDFLRPEDGAWSTDNPNVFYFVTTDNVTSAGGRSRLYSLTFSDITNPTAGGVIEMLLDGTEGGEMYDNMSYNDGKIILQEDVGNNSRLGKIWEYDVATGNLMELMEHDPARFLNGASNYLGTQDEESSGVISLEDILGFGWYAADVQAHYNISGELVQGGQLYVFQVVPEPASAALLSLGALAMLRRNRRKA